MPPHRSVHDRVRFRCPKSEQDLSELRKSCVGLRVSDCIYVAAVAGFRTRTMHLLDGTDLLSSAVHVDFDVSGDL